VEDRKCSTERPRCRVAEVRRGSDAIEIVLEGETADLEAQLCWELEEGAGLVRYVLHV
jgi:hypothetical protein